jgi:hypothetical protein
MGGDVQLYGPALNCHMHWLRAAGKLQVFASRRGSHAVNQYPQLYGEAERMLCPLK